MGFYIVAGGQRHGPFTLDQLKNQDLCPETLVWQQGFAAWTRANLVPELNELLRMMPPPLPPTPPEIPSVSATISGSPPVSPPHPQPVTARPWNPVLIGCLGLLFTPVWTGIMAALNARRLGLTTPLWRPVVIGFGSLGLAVLQGIWLDWHVLDVLLYLGALGLIAFLDLAPQQEPFRRYAETGLARGTWIVPSLTGSPLALCAFLVLVVAPFIPMEPRQVCEKFMKATGEREMKQCTTMNLWPALATLAKLDDKSDSGEHELTDEGPAPWNLGGYVVGFRIVFKDGKEHDKVEGFFHLVERQGEWKIEDMYFTSINTQPSEQPISVAANYLQIANASQQNAGTTRSRDEPKTKAVGEPKPKAEEPKRQVPQNWPILAWLGLKSFPAVGKAILGILAAIGAIIWTFKGGKK